MVEDDGARQHNARLQLEPGLNQCPVPGADSPHAGFEQPALVVAVQPEAHLAVTVQEQDPDNVELVYQHLVDPVDVGATRHFQSLGQLRVARIDQHPGLGKLRQQAGHFMASGDVLVEIAESGPQVLQVRLVIE